MPALPQKDKSKDIYRAMLLATDTDISFEEILVPINEENYWYVNVSSQPQYVPI